MRLSKIYYVHFRVLGNFIDLNENIYMCISGDIFWGVLNSCFFTFSFFLINSLIFSPVWNIQYPVILLYTVASHLYSPTRGLHVWEFYTTTPISESYCSEGTNNSRTLQ